MRFIIRPHSGEASVRRPLGSGERSGNDWKIRSLAREVLKNIQLMSSSRTSSLWGGVRVTSANRLGSHRSIAPLNAVDLSKVNGLPVLGCSIEDRRNPPAGRRGSLWVVPEKEWSAGGLKGRQTLPFALTAPSSSVHASRSIFFPAVGVVPRHSPPLASAGGLGRGQTGLPLIYRTRFRSNLINLNWTRTWLD